MYEVAPEGGDGGGGTTGGDPAPTDPSGSDDFQIPDKFKGETEKESLKKAVTSYQELEKELGKKGNSAQEIAEIKQTLNELRQSIVPKETTPEMDQLEEQKKIARSLGLAFQDDLTKARELGRKDAELDRINETLLEKYNGKDGRPTYDRQALTDFAKTNGYTTLHPETVYKLMYEKELDDWKVKQALKGNRSPAVIEGGKKGVKPQGDEPDVSKMSDEQRIAHMTQRAKEYLGD